MVHKYEQTKPGDEPDGYLGDEPVTRVIDPVEAAIARTIMGALDGSLEGIPLDTPGAKDLWDSLKTPTLSSEQQLAIDRSSLQVIRAMLKAIEPSDPRADELWHAFGSILERTAENFPGQHALDVLEPPAEQ